ncbi:hypothetical protein PV327_011313 [Microctonus hyperodae]|uniref:BED-type domain-containing protein n=1 Tax=Microctonus hyperodae TaxID=165561 RepID=A0AA39FKT0_MICHY|nr:hypothetical protein PV327_011313 [Microctonus hyperodae]
MSGFKRKRSELLAIEDESNSGDFSRTNRDKIASCKICINSKEIKMARGNTIGLRKHLRSKHPKAYFEIYPEEQKQLAEASTSRLTVPEMFAVKSKLK